MEHSLLLDGKANCSQSFECGMLKYCISLSFPNQAIITEIFLDAFQA
jgi:hypothetical protein